MQRQRYLLVTLAFLILFSGLVVHFPASKVLPDIPNARAPVTVSMSLTGCLLASGSCLHAGWNGTTAIPNPTITLNQGDTLLLKLSTADGAAHQFLIETDNDCIPAPCDVNDCPATDPCSQLFSAPITYSFPVTLSPGTYTYYCSVHPVPMHGTLIINPSGTVGGRVVSTNNTVIVAPYLAVGLIALVGMVLIAVYVRRAR